MNTLAHDNVVVSTESIYSESAQRFARWARKLVELYTGLLRRYHAVARQRHALAELSDAQLRDIGISREQALEEASRPFWK